MNMKTLRKILAVICMMALVVCISVGATIAYLTSQDTVTNTFTVGKVGIELWETKVDTEGKPVEGADPVKANEYHLLPGQTYVKDPTVTVKAESDEAYIRMMVEVKNLNKLMAAFPQEKYPTYYNGDLFLLQMLVTGWDNTVWEYKTFHPETNTYEFRHHETVTNAGTTDITLDPLFTNIVIPGSVTNTELAELETVEINVTAHAMQAAGFATADLAWEQFVPAK